MTENLSQTSPIQHAIRFQGSHQGPTLILNQKQDMHGDFQWFSKSNNEFFNKWNSGQKQPMHDPKHPLIIYETLMQGAKARYYK